MVERQFDIPEPLCLAGGIPDVQDFHILKGGGVSSALGFRASGIHAGFRRNPGRLDMALIVADEPSSCAATFTQNEFCAAPITVSRDNLGQDSCGLARVLVVNSGCANAATGTDGIENAQRSADLVASAIGCTPAEVMVASTGVIGVQLDMDVFETAIPAAVKALSREGGSDAAHAIMTTDTHAKQFAVTFSGDGIGYPGMTFTVGGMAKGSGMIMPNMATMIACITTDVPIDAQTLRYALVRAVSSSFNKITVDSDTSTNDCCFAFASGAAVALAEQAGQDKPAEPFVYQGAAYLLFERALVAVCETLARDMAADGEGATKLVTVRVAGAASSDDADLAARTVANSPLVKTAIYGHDANWGRIAAAIGRSGAHFKAEDASIDIMGLPVLRSGLPVPFDEDEALRRFERPEIDIEIDLGAGNESTVIWTCDFSHEYVTINGDYRT